MKKIPTLFVRDPDDMRHVLPEVHPDCGWVLAGEGIATRKYDGTCVALDDDGVWWARREVRPGKTAPPGFAEVEYDPATEKHVGWEPAEQSSWWRWLQDALSRDAFEAPGTFELIGPKVNGNPERWPHHALIRHAEAIPIPEVDGILRPGIHPSVAMVHLGVLLAELPFEGVVWHHPDGRMAKLKARDFR